MVEYVSSTDLAALTEAVELRPLERPRPTDLLGARDLPGLSPPSEPRRTLEKEAGSLVQPIRRLRLRIAVLRPGTSRHVGCQQFPH
jgi:hypothetical protein